jgi:hypothetical protein
VFVGLDKSRSGLLTSISLITSLFLFFLTAVDLGSVSFAVGYKSVSCVSGTLYIAAYSVKRKRKSHTKKSKRQRAAKKRERVKAAAKKVKRISEVLASFESPRRVVLLLA